MRPKKVNDRERVEKMKDFLHLAYKDYIGARALLRASLLLQGSVMASTSIEKYFKALMAIHGNFSSGHLKEAHFRFIENKFPPLYSSLNRSFLDFLAKSYMLRYTDRIPNGFNLHISRVQVLAELDYTVDRIMSGLSIQSREGSETRLTAYDVDIKEKNPQLYENNYILLNVTKERFLAQKDYIYETRFHEKMGPIEVYYPTDSGEGDGDFMKEAMATDPEKPTSFTLVKPVLLKEDTPKFDSK
jgi:hypothetical protein